MGDCFTLFLHLIYFSTSCDKALNDTAVNGIMLKLHKRLVFIYTRVCLFTSSCTCRNLSVNDTTSARTTLVDPLPTVKRRTDWCMGKASPEWFLRSALLHSPCSMCSQRIFNSFEPTVDNQWRLSNSSWIEIFLFFLFFLSLWFSFLNEFQWIVSWFDLCNSAGMRKDCVCNCFLMSLT